VALLKDKIENALNEARILILGGQVLIGFSYRAVFEPGFRSLTSLSRILLTVSLGLMLVGLGLVLSPASYHRIVEGGQISERFHRFLTVVLGIGLLPFAFALGAGMYVAGERLGHARLAIVAGLLTLVAALASWYGFELFKRFREEGRDRASATVRPSGTMQNQRREGDQPSLTEKIKEVLIETRMVLPGAQALLGFQFIIILMDEFYELPASSQYIHFASLAASAICTILLITPAAYHRIVLAGEDSEYFHQFAGRIMLLSMFFIALGSSGDFYVVCRKVTGSVPLSTALSVALLTFFYGLWFGWTTYRRRAA
jgi:hypothetical protein